TAQQDSGRRHTPFPRRAALTWQGISVGSGSAVERTAVFSGLLHPISWWQFRCSVAHFPTARALAVRAERQGDVVLSQLTSPRRHTDHYDHLEPLFTEAAASGTTDARRAELEQELILGHQPLAENIARRFRNRGQSLDDLRQVALLGLVNAV